MGLLTNKDYIIHPPQVFIKNTMAVDMFRKSYPDHFGRIECLVKQWIVRHMHSIYNEIDKIPPSLRENTKYPEYRGLKILEKCYDINHDFNEIMKDLMVDENGQEVRYYWYIFGNMYFYFKSNKVEVRISGDYSEHCLNKVPHTWFIYIQF